MQCFNLFLLSFIFGFVYGPTKDRDNETESDKLAIIESPFFFFLFQFPKTYEAKSLVYLILVLSVEAGWLE